MTVYENFKKIYIVLSVLFILFGTCMLVQPSFFAFALCYIVGTLCFVHGVMCLVGYFSGDLYRIAFQFDLALGIASVLLGIMILFHSAAFISAVHIIIGALTLFTGALRVQSAVDAKRFGISRWWLLLIGACLSIVLGILLVVSPFEGALTVTCIMGAVLIVEGIENLLVLLYMVKYRRN